VPTIKYRNAQGDLIPGTTTVISTNLGWNKQQLLWWANQEGLAGRNHRESTQKAADAGTICHAMVEDHIHGREWIANGEPAELIARALVAFGAYQEWEENTGIKIIATEIHLVSENYQYGATPDAIGVTKRGPVLLDWKSGGGTYSDHAIQLAGYRHAWEEVTGIALVGGYHLCRFDKESGGFSHKWWPQEALSEAWEVFVRLLYLHNRKRGLERLCK
jgi:hypothetical protein